MIYIVSHKNVSLPHPAGFAPIQVGADPEDYPGFIRDNTGDNIAWKNPNYCELTALYWIWKNTRDPYKGLVHYRRYFCRSPLLRGERNLISYREMTQMLCQADIILASPAASHVNCRQQILLESTTQEVLRLLARRLKRMYPDYVPAWRRFMAGNRASLFNMMFCRGQLFDEYCSWLFPLLGSLEQDIDLDRLNDYQKRVYGFLSERLLNIWVLHNRLTVRYLPVMNTDNSLMDDLTLCRRQLTNQLRFEISRLGAGQPQSFHR